MEGLSTACREKDPVRCPCRRLATLHGAPQTHDGDTHSSARPSTHCAHYGCSQVEQVLRVEKMRQVVLQNMRVDFARPALLPVCPPPYTNPPVVGHCHPTSRVMTGRGRGMLRALPRMPGICSVGQAQGILGMSGDVLFLPCRYI